ncbi:serine/threonine-protein kinase mos isoform X2 [Diabrotica undecimpunctata]|uniref:serine/threonine-protein kinase mos isoform X2 n=1 Tax=Diabrotica undecimpunctata TaxID=50387 RepID=UPI003B63ED64
MNTPLKKVTKLLSPRILSPVSPKFLNLINYPHIPNVENIKHIPKRINFSEVEKIKSVSPIQIRISQASEDLLTEVKNDVLINTPNKLKFTKLGIEDDKHFNIMGKGSFGKVFKAQYKGKTVAMKLVKSNSHHRETNSLHLNHTNIVKTLEIIQRKNGIYSLIIMEYLPKSKNLQNVINNSKFDIDYLKYSQDICKGLLHCHSSGILHLDIKPSNIVVYEGVCKICDFGNSVDISDNTSYINHVVKCNLRPDLKEPLDSFSKLYQQCWDQNPNNRPNVANVLKMLSC